MSSSSKKNGVNLAVVGATGAVGLTMREVLAQRKFPFASIRFVASSRSAGKKIEFCGEEFVVENLEEASFDNLDIALFSIPKEESKKFSPLAAKCGCVVVDNSNAFRMDPEVPLVVPEVNAHAISRHKGIIANPNCSTIQMVVALKPLHDAAKIKRVVVSTFQAVSGVSLAAMDELREQSRCVLDGKPASSKIFPHQMAFNCLPQIDVFLENRYTNEEMKMVNETRKIMEDESIRVTATTVRVPVLIGHSESVNIETERKLSVEEAIDILSKAPGVKVVDDPANQKYPMPVDAAGRDETFVGRIREDESIDNGLNLWVVSDNLRKGAALNAIQIAEKLL